VHERVVVDGFVTKPRTGVIWRLAWARRRTERRRSEEGIRVRRHDQPFPPVLDTLGTWETLQGVFEMTAQIANAFEIRARLQGRDIYPNDGVHFIICDGGVHFCCARGDGAESGTREWCLGKEAHVSVCWCLVIGILRTVESATMALGIAIEIRQKVVLSINGNSMPCG
jgi:hypothetical protein